MTFKTHFKFLIVVLTAAVLATNSFAQEETEDQPEGTYLAPWVKLNLDPLLDAPLQESLQSFSFSNRMSIIYVDGSSLIYALQASRPSIEERRDFSKMMLRGGFTISVSTCGLADSEEFTEMWKKTIAKISLRTEMGDTAQLSESIRELVLLTNSLTNTNGTVDTWWEEETGSKGTSIAWTDATDKREYLLSAWEEGDSDENWITFHITRQPMCP